MNKEELCDLSMFHQVRLTLKPNESTPKHHHQRTVETYLVLEGSGMIVTGGKEQPVKKGSFVNIPMHTPHQIRNTGSEDLVILSTKSGGSILADTYPD